MQENFGLIFKKAARGGGCGLGGGVSPHQNRQKRQNRQMLVSLEPLSAVIGGAKKPPKTAKNRQTHTPPPVVHPPLCSILNFSYPITTWWSPRSSGESIYLSGNGMQFSHVSRSAVLSGNSYVAKLGTR